jgi:predicted glycoside hydrolase/deacetylase ChbG (UPF0249 family)
MSFDGERENHQIFEIRFLATNEQANDVWILLSCTKEWREYDALDSQLRYGNWNLQAVNCAVTYAANLLSNLQQITKRHTELRSLCSQQVRKLLHAKGIEA